MTQPTPVSPVKNDKDRRKRRFLIWGAVAAVGALITSAAFVDSEWANISPEGGYATGQFNLQLSDDGGSTWSDNPSSGDALAIDLTGGHSPMLPGDVLTGTYLLGEEFDEYDATLSLSAESETSQAADVALRDALRFTVKVGGTTVVDNQAYGDLARSDFGTLTAGEDQEVEVSVTLPASEASNQAIQGGTAEVFLGITGETT